MCRAHATQTICRKAGCLHPIFVEAVPLGKGDGGTGIIRHPFCSVACARACGEAPRLRSVPVVPYSRVLSTISQVCAPLKTECCPAKVSSSSHGPQQPKKGQSEKRYTTSGSPSRGERDAKLYPSPPRTPSSDSDSRTL